MDLQGAVVVFAFHQYTVNSMNYFSINPDLTVLQLRDAIDERLDGAKAMTYFINDNIQQCDDATRLEYVATLSRNLDELEVLYEALVDKVGNKHALKAV